MKKLVFLPLTVLLVSFQANALEFQWPFVSGENTASQEPAPTITEHEAKSGLATINNLDVYISGLRDGSLEQSTRDRVAAKAQHELGGLVDSYKVVNRIQFENDLLQKKVAWQELGLYAGIPAAAGFSVLAYHLWKKHTDKYTMDMPVDDDED